MNEAEGFTAIKNLDERLALIELRLEAIEAELGELLEEELS